MVLAEIYITFEVITFLIFLKGLDEAKAVYFILAMGFFLSLAVASFSINGIFVGTEVVEWVGVGMNFGLGLLSFAFGLLAYFDRLAGVMKRGE